MSDKFKILWIDNTIVRRTILQVGENVIGNIMDEDGIYAHICEPAAVIELSPDGEISITPCEKILCFVKSYGASRWKSASSNWSTPLNVRDTCLLFPVKIWLKVLSAMDDESEITCATKRKLEDLIDEEPANKKCCLEVTIEMEPSISLSCNSNHEPMDEENFIEGDEKNGDYREMIHMDSIDTISMQSSNFDIDKDIFENQESSLICTSNKCDVKKDLEMNLMDVHIDSQQYSKDKHSELEIEQQNENNVEKENDHNSEHVQQNEISKVTENHNSDSKIEQQNENVEEATNDNNINNNNEETNQGETSVQTKNPPREKCKYGEKCYRVNQEHKEKFSHPKDADYDQPDNRPECPYGIKCYRKNPQHKLDYKHTHRKQAPNKTRSPINLSDLSDNEYSDESVDESEYEPSFIDDDDLDSFESSFEDEER